MLRVLPFAAALLLLWVATGAGAEGGSPPEKVGGVELGDPQWCRSYFSARGYHRDRSYDARRYHRDRQYARDRCDRNRRYANERYPPAGWTRRTG